MALSLGTKCFMVIRGHLRNPGTLPILYNTIRKEHRLPQDIAEASKVDQPLDNFKNPFEREKTQCILCKYNITPNYKNVRLLSQFQSSYTGRIYGRHITRLCAKKQADVEREIIKSQSAGYMGIYTKEKTFLDDPRIFDPENPIRQHRF